jgi:spermidine synthase
VSEAEEPGFADEGGLDRRAEGVVLIGAVAVASVCGLVFELTAGALSSYLLGSSVAQFSLVIGVFLTGMGIGSWASQLLRGELLGKFVAVELGAGLVGGTLPLAGFAAFAWTPAYQPVLLAWLTVTGALIGLEIPLVVRILRARSELRSSVANVLAADYLGALLASVAFPFLLLPAFGLVRGGLLAGLANVGVAAVTLVAFRRQIPARRVRGLTLACAAAAALLGVGFAGAPRWVSALESDLFQDTVVYARDSAYQRIVVTRWRDDVRLFLDGNLQFSSKDEHRYHESLVHPAMALVPEARRVLILGGGDGLAARQVLRYAEVDRVDLVDLDPAITELFTHRPLLAALNGGALADPRVVVHNADALRFLEAWDGHAWDVVLLDLPDPNTPALGKLYTRSFYRLAVRHLSERGVLVTQATSPFATREAFWCIAHTLAATEISAATDRTLEVHPFAVHVPSFGEWGFVLASKRRVEPAIAALRVEGRYLTQDVLGRLFALPGDISEVPTGLNDLESLEVVRLYEAGADRIF